MFRHSEQDVMFLIRSMWVTEGTELWFKEWECIGEHRDELPVCCCSQPLLIINSL